MRTKGTCAAVAVLGLLVSLVTGCGRSSETVGVVDPAPGAVVTLPFVVTLEASVPLGTPADGLHHVHVWFGDDLSSYLVVEDTTVEVPYAPAGEHEMHVSLRNADHTETGASVSIPLVISIVPGG